ncbi:MAG: ferredoxin [Polyangiales bacterium]
MRVVVDFDLCQGHGACEGEAPAVFELDDGGKLTVLQAEPPEELREAVEMARKYCPTMAIKIEEDNDA